jgi:hypothetical protein
VGVVVVMVEVREEPDEAKAHWADMCHQDQAGVRDMTVRN